MPLADIVGFDRASQVKLVAEVKNRRDVTPEWAIKFRRNLMAHGRILPGVYFLLVVPDRLYLWTPKSAANLDQEPEFSSEIPPWVSESAGSTSASMEYTTLGWLTDLPRLSASENKSTQQEYRWAIESGLAETLRGGRVEFENAL